MDAFMDVLLPRPAPDQRLLYPHPIVILVPFRHPKRNLGVFNYWSAEKIARDESE